MAVCGLWLASGRGSMFAFTLWAGWAFSAEGGGTTRLTVIFYISDFHERFTHYHAGEGLD